MMRKTINAIKQFFGGEEHTLEEPSDPCYFDEIDIATYNYNSLDDFESPVMCGVCGTTPAKYNVLTHPNDGPSYSHDYCGKCFTGPLAKEQIDPDDPRV